jgi:hypothetical protein
MPYWALTAAYNVDVNGDKPAQCAGVHALLK